MNCRDFERWLDDGSPPANRAGFALHARDCAACARALAAADALATALAEPMPRVPLDFTDRVLARIERPAPSVVLAPATPWWLRALTEPAALLALLLIAVLTTAWNPLWSMLGTGTAALAQRLNSGWTGVTDGVVRTRWGALLERPEVASGLLLGALCLVMVSVPALYRMSLRVTSRAAFSTPGWGSRRLFPRG